MPTDLTNLTVKSVLLLDRTRDKHYMPQKFIILSEGGGTASQSSRHAGLEHRGNTNKYLCN